MSQALLSVLATLLCIRQSPCSPEAFILAGVDETEQIRRQMVVSAGKKQRARSSAWTGGVQ